MGSPAFDLPEGALRGRVVAITGASRGLGAGMAVRFAELGASLGLCARSEPEPPPGVPAVCARVDVATAIEVEGFAHAVVSTLGPIDLWINNAGILGPVGPARTIPAEAVDDALRVNVGGVVNGTRAFVARARSWSAGRRALVNISSGAGRSGYAGWSVYGATKAAVDRFTEVVAVEEPDLVCASVAPGVVETAMQEEVRRSDVVDFPAVDRFRRIHAEGTANSPSWVADHLAAILLGSLRPDDVLYRVPDEHP